MLVHYYNKKSETCSATYCADTVNCSFVEGFLLACWAVTGNTFRARRPMCMWAMRLVRMLWLDGQRGAWVTGSGVAATLRRRGKIFRHH
jgi:hypothetical protein